MAQEMGPNFITDCSISVLLRARIRPDVDPMTRISGSFHVFWAHLLVAE